MSSSDGTNETSDVARRRRRRRNSLLLVLAVGFLLFGRGSDIGELVPNRKLP